MSDILVQAASFVTHTHVIRDIFIYAFIDSQVALNINVYMSAICICICIFIAYNYFMRQLCTSMCVCDYANI